VSGPGWPFEHAHAPDGRRHDHERPLWLSRLPAETSAGRPLDRADGPSPHPAGQLATSAPRLTPQARRRGSRRPLAQIVALVGEVIAPFFRVHEGLPRPPRRRLGAARSVLDLRAVAVDRRCSIVGIPLLSPRQAAHTGYPQRRARRQSDGQPSRGRHPGLRRATGSWRRTASARSRRRAG